VGVLCVNGEPVSNIVFLDGEVSFVCKMGNIDDVGGTGNVDTDDGIDDDDDDGDGDDNDDGSVGSDTDGSDTDGSDTDGNGTDGSDGINVGNDADIEELCV